MKITNRKGERGGVLVMMAGGITAFIGMTALAIDLGRAYMIHTELQNTSDLTALAAARYFSSSEKDNPAELLKNVQDVAQLTARQHRVHDGSNRDLIVLREDVVPGRYDFDHDSFSKRDIETKLDRVNAFRVRIRQGNTTNAPILNTFARIFTQTPLRLNTTSVAAIGKRHVVIALDISASMTWGLNTNEGYKRLTRCKTADLYTDDRRRHFRWTPLAAYDKDECLGGLPQPVERVFKQVRLRLLENPIFTDSYRAGLVVYESKSQIRVRMDQDNNKNKVIGEIKGAYNYWADYAAAEDPSLFDPNKIFPGGADPGNLTAPTGMTNIGAAISDARAMIAAADATADSQSLDMIILLSDGVPNCDETGFCSNDSPGREAGKAYSRSEAEKAANSNIQIYAIFFGQKRPSCDGLEQDECHAVQQRWSDLNGEGYRHMGELAEITGGKSFYAGDVNQLGEIFETKLTINPPFVLVPD